MKGIEKTYRVCIRVNSPEISLIFILIQIPCFHMFGSELLLHGFSELAIFMHAFVLLLCLKSFCPFEMVK